MLNLEFLSLDVVAGPEVLNVSMPIAVQMTAVIDGACWLGSAEVQMLLEFGKNPPSTFRAFVCWLTMFLLWSRRCVDGACRRVPC